MVKGWGGKQSASEEFGDQEGSGEEEARLGVAKLALDGGATA